MFSLDDTGFQFANGTQHLLTNVTDWGFSNSGFGGPYSAPLDEGLSGTAPWGSPLGISGAAHFIWDNPACGSCTTYFSTAITSTAAANGAAPESATFALFGSAALLIGTRELFAR
jgi:hypothetical protein